jgi:hypothetical protein
MADNNNNNNSNTNQKSTAADIAMLTPSQAIRSTSGGSGNQNSNIDNNAQGAPNTTDNSNNPSRRRRRRNRGKGPTATADASATASIKGNNNNSNKHLNPSAETFVPTKDDQASSNNQPKKQGDGKQRGRERQRGKKGNNQKPEAAAEQGQPAGNKNAKITQNKNNKRKSKKKYPWRRFIPKGTVDPITLENLQTLEYPPFALCADEPYVPVPEWPIPEEGEKQQQNSDAKAAPSLTSSKAKSEADLEQLHRQRLAEQWGTALVTSDNTNENNKKPSATSRSKSSDPPGAVLPPSKRPYNLFDGRALAYYMVSQLQFIDPLNRRDLTRPELVNLDNYLKRHGLFTGDLKVTEAYDAKGITISSAGAAASTAQGRADVMQQMAQQLLNSLFSGHSVTSPRLASARQQATQSFSLQEQYASMQRQEQASAQQRLMVAGASSDPFLGDGGIYGSVNNDGGGFMIIDDDENPEMRGRNDFPSLEATTRNVGSVPDFPVAIGRYASSLGTDGRMSSQNSSGPAFPALQRPMTSQEVTTPATASSAKKPAPKASKTLSKISGLVKKTDPEEKQRQWEAREAARRRAMMSNLSYGMDPSMAKSTAAAGSAPPMAILAGNDAVSNEMLERNRAFAIALGVKPATHRHYKSGWARPTESEITLDEFGNELNAALYPEALIAMARERMPQLLKLEKKWKTFLADDKAASLPLNPMDRASRAFVHHYAEFWDLKTESFDPEPKRYIHCVKLPSTHAPHPLLSDAARSWRGPLPDVSRIQLSEHSLLQTAGQSSKSRDAPATAVASLPAAVNSRVDALLVQERPKLDLAPRTVPLELPPFEQQQHEEAAAVYDAAEDLKRQQARLEEKRQRQREAELKKKQALEDAFASDDEEEEETKPSASVIDEDWGEEPQPLFDGSEDE